jgi:hypothetical protein
MASDTSDSNITGMVGRKWDNLLQGTALPGKWESYLKVDLE